MLTFGLWLRLNMINLVKMRYSLTASVISLLQMVQTPLHVSAGNNRCEIVKFLLDWQGPEKIELEARNMVGICFISADCL